MVRYFGLALIGACSAAPPALEGSWVLEGEGVHGQVRGEPAAGCRDGRVLVGIWGPRWGTPGEVAAVVENQPGGANWLFFALETGVGTGRAALHVQGQEARLPLGGRTGEFDLLLSVTPGVSDAAETEAWQWESREALEVEQGNWADGRFSIFDEGDLVGDVLFQGSDPTLISVYDSWWLTPHPVVAERQDDGTDVVLAFPAEPSIFGETAALRINIPTREAVVPSGLMPSEIERRLTLVPGGVSVEMREARIEAAIEENIRLEKEGVVELLMQLAAQAREDTGECRSMDKLKPEIRGTLSGYSLEMQMHESECRIRVDPVLVQHGRRFSGTVGPRGLVGE